MSLGNSGGEYVVGTAGKLTPSLAVTGGVMAGVPLQDWVLIATLVYTVLQITLTVFNFVKKRRNGG